MTVRERALLLSECFLIGFLIVIPAFISLLDQNGWWLVGSLVLAILGYRPFIKRFGKLLKYLDSQCKNQ
jgi:4-hydroxybenzoate polyprenyltransferase